jgi:hypothetical protein
MTWKSMLLGAALASFGLVAPLAAGSGVTDQQRRACEKKADLVRPALRTPEREQFIANCLADATATNASKGKK